MVVATQLFASSAVSTNRPAIYARVGAGRLAIAKAPAHQHLSTSAPILPLRPQQRQGLRITASAATGEKAASP